MTMFHHALLPLWGAANLKASPLPPAPPATGSEVISRVLKRFTLGSQSIHLRCLESIFWRPGSHVGDPGVPRDNPHDTFGSRFLFFIDFGWNLGTSWHSLRRLLILLDFELSMFCVCVCLLW